VGFRTLGAVPATVDRLLALWMTNQLIQAALTRKDRMLMAKPASKWSLPAGKRRARTGRDHQGRIWPHRTGIQNHGGGRGHRLCGKRFQRSDADRGGSDRYAAITAREPMPPGVQRKARRLKRPVVKTRPALMRG
jgi:hypothetical protein